MDWTIKEGNLFDDFGGSKIYMVEMMHSVVALVALIIEQLSPYQLHLAIAAPQLCHFLSSTEFCIDVWLHGVIILPYQELTGLILLLQGSPYLHQGHE